MRRSRGTVWTVVALGALILAVSPLEAPTARACAICALGDPTLTTMGLEKPLAGRKRLSVTGHVRSMEEGRPGVDQVLSDEQRLELASLWSPTRWLSISAGLPMVRNHRTLVSGARETSWGLGDLGLHGRIVVWQDPGLRARHVVSVEIGGSLPTAPTLTGPDGERLEAELQAGLGSFAPQLGVAYGYFHAPWAIFASTSAQQPLPSRFDLTLGRAWLSTLMAQRSMGTTISLQLGLDSRWAASNRRADVRDLNSGGFVLAGAVGVVWSPITDLVFNATVRIPGLQLANGENGEGVSASLGIAFDL